MFQILSAIATSIVVIAITILLSKHFSAKLIAATTLCSIAFIYVGFALMGNTAISITVEIAIALCFYFIAITGYSKNNNLISFGIILHGLWDISHQGEIFVKTNIPDYWSLYCILTDSMLGVYFFFNFKKRLSNKALTNIF